MSYLVLARKYRPQTFEQVVGQDHVTRTLSNAFAQDRVHHAFLFCGPRGVGKTTAARILGKALNCEKGPTAQPCGVCQACTSITEGRAIDYFEMDGASNRGIDSIRNLTEAVCYQPALLRKKVYVVDEVHMLTTEAFNALLKTLEEPPPHVAFVMATTEAHKVPNTILSRCQRYDFKLVPAQVLAEHLAAVFAKEDILVETSAISLIVRESGGSVRDAMSLCDQVISFVGKSDISEVAVAKVLGVADRALTESLVLSLAAGDAKSALERVEQALTRGIGEFQLCRAVVRYLRNLAVLQVGAPSVLGDPEERAAISAQAETLSPARVRQMFERALRACDEIGQTQEPRLVLELAFIDMATLEPLIPLGELVDRLGDLERKLMDGRGGGSGGQRARMPQSPRPSSAQGGASAAQPPPQKKAIAQPSRGLAAESVSRCADEISRAAASPGSVSAELHAEASAKTGLSAEDFQLWDGIMSALAEQHKLSLVGLFQEAKLFRVTEHAIEVGCPEEHFNADHAVEKDKVREMTGFISAHLGRPIHFSARILSAADLEKRENVGCSLVELKENAAKIEREERIREAREHPMTKVVLATFGANIKEIKTNV